MKRIYVLIGIALLLSSCEPAYSTTLDPNLYDQSWFTGKPCAVPCWYGLELGISSRQASLSTIKRLPFIDGNSGVLTNSEGATFSYKVSHNISGVDLNFANNILESMNFVLNYKITFDQAVAKLGPPTGFSILPLYPDAGGCSLSVVWIDKILVLQYQTGIIGFFSKGRGRDEELCDLYAGGKLPNGILVHVVFIMRPSDFPMIGVIAPLWPWVGFKNK